MKTKLKQKLSVRNWSWKKRSIVGGVVVLCLLVMFVLHQANSPAVGTIAVSRQDQPVITDSTDYTTTSNEYFSLLYPSDLTPDFPAQQAAGSLAYVYFDKKDSEQNVKSSLEAYARTLPPGGITIDQDYDSIKSQPDLYKLSQKYVRGELVDVGTRNKGTAERIGLWVHGKYLLILKLKGTDKSALDDQFDTILKSVQWSKS